MDRLQHVGGGDVAHVEGRVLPHQHDIALPEIGTALFASREVVAGFITHADIIAGGEQRAAAKRQRLRLVVEQRMAAPLCFQHHGEGRVALDVDGLDRVHLHCHLQRHAQSSP